MAKKTIVTQTVNAVRDVAEAAFDAAAAQARRVIVETVANTAARVEERAKQAMPAVEGAVKRRLVKPVDRMLGTRTRPAARITAPQPLLSLIGLSERGRAPSLRAASSAERQVFPGARCTCRRTSPSSRRAVSARRRAS